MTFDEWWNAVGRAEIEGGHGGYVSTARTAYNAGAEAERERLTPELDRLRAEVRAWRDQEREGVRE